VSRLDVTARSRGGAYREDVNKVWIQRPGRLECLKRQVAVDSHCRGAIG
jgi:hypothetical protein